MSRRPTPKLVEAENPPAAEGLDPLVPKPGKHRAKINPEVRAEIFARDGFCCVKCGATNNLTIDHIKPLNGARGKARRKLNRKENYQTLCFDCNVRKGNT